MRGLAVAVLLVALATPALADEPRGCDKFKWPLETERAALTSHEKLAPQAGAELDRTSPVAIAVALAPLKDAKLAIAPERAPKNADGFAGALSFAAAADAGKYKVTLSDAGWIDVIQNEHALKPTAFTGALDCPGVRKSVEFELGAEPFVLQLSDVAAPTISVVLTPSQ
jgi:hypothetical protein